MTVIGGIVMGNYFSYMRISTKEERGKQKYTRQENSLERYARNQGIDYVIQFREDASGKSFINRSEWNRLEKIIQDLVIRLCSKTLRDLHVRPKMDMRSIWN